MKKKRESKDTFSSSSEETGETEGSSEDVDGNGEELRTVLLANRRIKVPNAIIDNFGLKEKFDEFKYDHDNMEWIEVPVLRGEQAGNSF